MNELIGDVTLTLVLIAVLYFVIAAKMKLGFRTTLFFSAPFVFIMGLAIGGFTATFAFATIVAGLMFAYLLNRIIENR